MNQKAEEFQEVIAPLQQALQTVQQATQLQQAQNPMNVLPPPGTVNVMPGQDQNPAQVGMPDPNAPDLSGPAAALAGPLGGGAPAPPGAAGAGAAPGGGVPDDQGGPPPAAAGGGLPPDLEQQMAQPKAARRGGSGKGRPPTGGPRQASSVFDLWKKWQLTNTGMGGEPDYQAFAQRFNIGRQGLNELKRRHQEQGMPSLASVRRYLAWCDRYGLRAGHKRNLDWYGRNIRPTERQQLARTLRAETYSGSGEVQDTSGPFAGPHGSFPVGTEKDLNDAKSVCNMPSTRAKHPGVCDTVENMSSPKQGRRRRAEAKPPNIAEEAAQNSWRQMDSSMTANGYKFDKASGHWTKPGQKPVKNHWPIEASTGDDSWDWEGGRHEKIPGPPPRGHEVGRSPDWDQTQRGVHRDFRQEMADLDDAEMGPDNPAFRQHGSRWARMSAWLDAASQHGLPPTHLVPMDETEFASYEPEERYSGGRHETYSGPHDATGENPESGQKMGRRPRQAEWDGSLLDASPGWFNPPGWEDQGPAEPGRVRLEWQKHHQQDHYDENGHVRKHKHQGGARKQGTPRPVPQWAPDEWKNHDWNKPIDPNRDPYEPLFPPGLLEYNLEQAPYNRPDVMEVDPRSQYERETKDAPWQGDPASYENDKKRRPEYYKRPFDAARKQSWSGWGPAQFPKTRQVTGWDWNPRLEGYLANRPQRFACECGDSFDTPTGFHRCACGKQWNSYVIGTGGSTHEASAEKYLVREIPVRHDVIVANRKLARPQPDGTFTREWPDSDKFPDHERLNSPDWAGFPNEWPDYKPKPEHDPFGYKDLPKYENDQEFYDAMDAKGLPLPEPWNSRRKAPDVAIDSMDEHNQHAIENRGQSAPATSFLRRLDLQAGRAR